MWSVTKCSIVRAPRSVSTCLRTLLDIDQLISRAQHHDNGFKSMCMTTGPQAAVVNYRAREAIDLSTNRCCLTNYKLSLHCEALCAVVSGRWT